jgi:hypothetical protein
MKSVLTILVLFAFLAAAIIEARNWICAFRGEICVAKGKSERLVVAAARGEPRISFLRRKQDFHDETPDALPFENPATSAKLLGAGRYDAARLPFSILLKQVDVLNEEEPRNLLKISAPDSERTIDLKDKGDIRINGEPYRMETVRKWSGLMRYPSGEPLAALSLRRPAERWTENVFVAADTWRRIEPDIALRLTWCVSEEAARQAQAGGLPGIETARWGVVEGGVVDWSASFAPGTGAELKNGGTATLLKLDESGTEPAIEVEFSKGGQRKTERAVANERSSEARVLFEYPSRLETVILVYAFEDGKALLVAYHQHKPCGERVLSAGERWSVEGMPFEIRLDQALQKALPVSEEDSTVYEAVLRGPPRDLRLRQGEAVRSGDASLEYFRKTSPPRVRYSFAVPQEGPLKERTFTLGPDDAVRVMNWRFSQGPSAGDPTHMAVLDARETPAWSMTRIIMAGSLAALVWLMFFTRPGSSPELAQQQP